MNARHHEPPDRGRARGRPVVVKRPARRDPFDEVARLAPEGSVERLRGALSDAAHAYERERFGAARRTLEEIRDHVPGAAGVRELLGLTLYRLDRYREARRELEEFVRTTGSVEQHPVLMDCCRALDRQDEVEVLWRELRENSSTGELVTEGRIVMAGSLAERGRLGEAIDLLSKGPVRPKRVRDHHLRLWYALADLEERAGNLPRARGLFEQVRAREPAFADVAERLAGLR